MAWKALGDGLPSGLGPRDAHPTSVSEAGERACRWRRAEPHYCPPSWPRLLRSPPGSCGPSSALRGHTSGPFPRTFTPSAPLHPGLGSQHCLTAGSPTPHTTDKHHWLLPWRVLLGNVPAAAPPTPASTARSTAASSTPYNSSPSVWGGGVPASRQGCPKHPLASG